MNFLASFGHTILEAVLPSMATVIAGMLMIAVKRFLKKQGLELTEQQEVRLKQIVVDKIHATEEAARRGEVKTAEEKKALTVNAATVAAIDDPHLPNPTIAHVEAITDSELNKLRTADPTRPGLGRR